MITVIEDQIPTADEVKRDKALIESIYDDELMGILPEEASYKKPPKTKKFRHKKSGVSEVAI